jgi:cardiolipin synthase
MNPPDTPQARTPVDDCWRDFLDWWPYIVAAVDIGLIGWFVPRVLMTKSEAISAVAWCLLIIFVPLFGAAMFVLFGYQHVSRPLRRKRRHKQQYRGGGGGRRRRQDGGPALAAPEGEKLSREALLMAKLARQFDAQEVTAGNQIDFYHDGKPAFDAMLAAIRQARHHVHLQKFIFQPDATGDEFLAALTEKAKQGVEVRLLYDAVGSHRLRQSRLTALRAAGGRCSVFLPINLLRRSIQVNLRNHRKILVTDCEFGFVGGLNIGDEYLGRVPRFGPWRDTHLRLQGPVVADLQRVFAEDWDFAAGESLIPEDDDPARCVYLQTREVNGPYRAQIIDSGPDRDLKAIREIYHAAILKARRRVWIASPYFVPDAGLRDALRLAGYQGVDVRFLGQYRPDKMIPQMAARYYWAEVLSAGVKVYQYTRGMMHAKVVLVDDDWASVGTANLDNRSLHLNFEVNCLIYSHQAVAELAAQYERDLETAVRLDCAVYGQRPMAARLLENACRLMSPVL